MAAVAAVGREWDEDGVELEDARPVRPYTVTGGRTRTGSEPLALETLVRATGAVGDSAGPEPRAIVELTGPAFLSVAEISAHLWLPLGVVRVLVSDLAHTGLVAVHRSGPATGAARATDASFLEGILDGISSL